MLKTDRKLAFGLKPEKKIIHTKYSFNLKTKEGWINIVNPFRGILVVGGAGAGKSFSIGNPIIKQAILKGYTGLVYDFKYPTLAEEIHKALIYGTYNGMANPDLKYYVVNFRDMETTHRLNPIKPENLPVTAFAEEFSKAIINNLNTSSIKRMEFFDLSANAWLTAIIWFYKKKHPQLCTLPHVVNTALYEDYTHVIAMLENEPQCADMIRSISTAIKNKAEKQIAAVIASLQILLVKINSPEIVWVLSGDDFDLNLNDPKNPKVLCLGSDPTLKDTFSPVISCIITVALKLMNQQGKLPSFALLDEAPTIYVPNLEVIPATARSNKVATVVMVQDFAQMVDTYGQDKKEVLVSNLNNQCFGKVSNLQTARAISDTIGREDKEMEGYSKGQSKGSTGSMGSNHNVSVSVQERHVVKPQDVIKLNVGEFIGQTVEGKEPFFWAKVDVQRDEARYDIKPVAVFRSRKAEREISELSDRIHGKQMEIEAAQKAYDGFIRTCMAMQDNGEPEPFANEQAEEKAHAVKQKTEEKTQLQEQIAAVKKGVIDTMLQDNFERIKQQVKETILSYDNFYKPVAKL